MPPVDLPPKKVLSLKSKGDFWTYCLETRFNLELDLM